MELLVLEEGGDWGRASFCRVQASEVPRSSVGLDRIAEDAFPSRRVSYPITLECSYMCEHPKQDESRHQRLRF